MCRGLAIVVEKIGDEWEVYAMGGCGSHDQLLSYLDDGLKYAKRPHLKFELLYPNVLVDDIVQECANDPRAYPKEWLEYRAGRWRAVMSAFSAVMQFISEHPSLTISFTPKMMEGAQLYGANLSGADLSRADLSRADLYGADLSRADLSRADLSRANLSGADLSGADLSRADLYGADLSWANLSRADLSRANLYGADLSRANLSRANLSRANLKYALGKEYAFNLEV